MAEFDFSTLTVEETELPGVRRGRTRHIEHNPFLGPVGDSYNDGKGRAVKVPNEHYKTTENLIRRAAEDLEIGVRVVPSLTAEERDKAPKNKTVTVKFQGQPKRKRRTKAEIQAAKSNTETQPETPQN